jgi:hypothetical protein
MGTRVTLGPITAQSSGQLVNAGDSVAIALPGNQWATALFSITVNGTATLTTQVSIDGGVNWITSAYSKRLDLVNANPTVTALIASSPGVSSWEVSLPANATHFRILCAGTGTTLSLTLFGGAAYIPGMPVAAVLYDVTSAVNTQLTITALDMSGWASLSAFCSTPAGGSGLMQPVDDAGVALPGGGINIPASASIAMVLGSVGATIASTVPATGVIAVPWRWKRLNASSAAVAALTSRIRIEASR